MKPIEQKDKYNQRLKLVVEQRNGQPANLDRYLHGLLKTQSLAAWNGNQEELAKWAAGCVRDYVENLDFTIWGYGPDVPPFTPPKLDGVYSVTHLVKDGNAATLCCGKSIFELPQTDRVTVDRMECGCLRKDRSLCGHGNSDLA